MIQMLWVGLLIITEIDARRDARKAPTRHFIRDTYDSSRFPVYFIRTHNPIHHVDIDTHQLALWDRDTGKTPLSR